MSSIHLKVLNKIATSQYWPRGFEKMNDVQKPNKITNNKKKQKNNYVDVCAIEKMLSQYTDDIIMMSNEHIANKTNELRKVFESKSF